MATVENFADGTYTGTTAKWCLGIQRINAQKSDQVGCSFNPKTGIGIFELLIDTSPVLYMLAMLLSDMSKHKKGVVVAAQSHGMQDNYQ